jgi:hypothetical protein
LIQEILSAFPPPTGPDMGDGESGGLQQLGRTASLASYSLRIDRALGPWGNLFGRLNVTPSTSNSPPWSNGSQGHTHWSSLTVGLTAGRSGGPIFDLRFNYSHATLLSTFRRLRCRCG